MNGSNISRSSHEAIESSSSEEPSPPCPLVPLTMTDGGLRIGINGNYISCSSYEDVESPPCPLVHFTMTEGGNDNGCFECNYCGQLIDCGSENDGSCVLWYHLGNDCEEYKNRVVDEKQNILSFDTKECDSSCGSSLEKEKEAIIGACAQMIILDELRFTFVEKRGFRHFWSSAVPYFDPPSHITMAREVYRLYLSEKGLLKSMFSSNKPRVCLSIYYWTSVYDIDYMVLTAHFIDDEWRLQKKMLNFSVIPDHKGETIGETIESCLLAWGIERVFAITVDNVSENVVGINLMKEKFKSRNVDGIVLEGEFLLLQCFTHSVNSIVNENFKDIYYDDSIVSIRNAISYVRSSSASLEKCKTCIKPDLVVLDVPNSLNSTYLMLASALKFQNGFKRLEEEDEHYATYFSEDEFGERSIGPPSKDDWEKAQAIVGLLKIFHDVILKFTTPLCVTSSTYLHEICSIQFELRKLSESGDTLIGTMATSMKKKFDEHWGSIDSMHKLLIISLVLDPRYKLDYVTFCFEKIYGDAEVENFTRGIKELLFHLFDVYNALDTSHGVQSSNDVQPLNGMDVEKEKYRHDLFAEFKKFRETKGCTEDAHAHVLAFEDSYFER
ncbi:hypothetical protein LWI29_012409 [Acer saccharum]|uniref:hAT-like transposase RNase-H fold domain-containing protein n=1 Tax=Acer saccharum TaxID=4024 RepID=A0AA39VX31_ACESA|nr:hypothetical protein LWI29_012409 [Acer saccharum]